MTCETISTIFSTIWATICSAFHAIPVLGAILAFAIGSVGVAVIFVLTTMFVMGFLERGFAFGWKIHGLLNWEFYCGQID